VLSYNFATHKLEPSVISYVQSFKVSDKYTFNNNLQVDKDEIMFINGRWERAYQAKVGDVLFDPLTDKNVTITSINISNVGGTVYDFFGSPLNNFIANGFLIDYDTSPSGWTQCSVYGNGLITLANGTEENINSLKVGTPVMSYNLISRKLAVSYITAIKYSIINQVVIINNNLITDQQEVVIANGKDTLVENLKIGDKLFNPITNQSIVVTSIRVVNETTPIYDIDTAPIDDYIVNGYLIT